MQSFLADHPEFELRSSFDDFARLTRQTDLKPLDAAGTGITLSPATSDTDGFYFCLMQRGRTKSKNSGMVQNESI